MIKSADLEEFEAIERSLAADSRKGVRDALASARRRFNDAAAEKQRVKSLYEFDRSHCEAPGDLIVGLDEVGRGAVAGPLAVGAVVLADSPLILGLNDSKKLTSVQRTERAEEIRRVALAYAVYYIEPEEIDKRGMSSALRKGFSGALAQIESMGITPDVVLLDGNRLGIDAREVNVVKGDSKSAAIGAASIVAKATRDEAMVGMSTRFPHYGFQHNKGYASRDHIDAIRSFGLSPVHRASFCKSFLQEALF